VLLGRVPTIHPVGGFFWFQVYQDDVGRLHRKFPVEIQQPVQGPGFLLIDHAGQERPDTDYGPTGSKCRGDLGGLKCHPIGQEQARIGFLVGPRFEEAPQLSTPRQFFVRFMNL